MSPKTTKYRQQRVSYMLPPQTSCLSIVNLCLRAGFVIAILGLFGLAAISNAQEQPRISLSAGKIGISDSLDENNYLALEYLFPAKTRLRLTPALGLSVAEDGSFYVYADLKRHFRLSRHWLLTPSLGAGLYEGGDEVDLGHVVEFKSGLELGYEFDNRLRLGLGFFHISNASLSNNNPGTEILAGSISVPLP